MKKLIAALIAVSWIPIAMVSVRVQAAELEGTTKKGTFACETKTAMVEAHSALRAMQFDRFKSFYGVGTCWEVSPGKKTRVLQDGEWGRPIQVTLEGRTFWLMQHMLRYSTEKENENDLCKVLFVAGVGVECGWAPKKTIVTKLAEVSNFAVQKLGVSPDRLSEIQTLHIPGGKTFVKKHGCGHPYVLIMKDEYGKFFSAQPSQ